MRGVVLLENGEKRKKRNGCVTNRVDKLRVVDRERKGAPLS